MMVMGGCGCGATAAVPEWLGPAGMGLLTRGGAGQSGEPSATSGPGAGAGASGEPSATSGPGAGAGASGDPCATSLSGGAAVCKAGGCLAVGQGLGAAVQVQLFSPRPGARQLAGAQVPGFETSPQSWELLVDIQTFPCVPQIKLANAAPGDPSSQ